MRLSRRLFLVLSFLLCVSFGFAQDQKIVDQPALEKAVQPPKVLLFTEESLYEDQQAESGPLPYHPQTVLPEIAARVSLSSVDVNRLVCEEGPVRDVIFSREKGVTVRVEGSSVFVKYEIAVNPKTGEKVFARFPTELYVICGDGSVYTLIAAPQKIPAQTVVLKSAVSSIKKVQRIFSGMSHEVKILNLIKWAYREEIPSELTVLEVNKPVELFENLKIVLRRIINAEGEGLALKEYLVSAEGTEKVRLTEKQFLTRRISEKPLAVALSDHLVGKEPVRLFVVERGVEK